ISGSLPALNATLGMATRYTTVHPDTSGVQPGTYTFSVSDLSSLDVNQNAAPLMRRDLDRTRDFGNGQADHGDRLQGRFVQSIRVIRPDGTEIDFDGVLIKPSLVPTSVPGTETSGLRVTNPTQIIKALRAAGVSDLSRDTSTVEVTFYHPDDKPA